MQFIAKLLISVFIIIVCTQAGRKAPSLAGLIAVMPLASLIVLVWLYADNPGNFGLLTEYTKGALLGIIPTVLFFLTAFMCFRKQMSLWMVLCASFAVWLIASAVHQWLLHK